MCVTDLDELATDLRTEEDMTKRLDVRFFLPHYSVKSLL